MASRPEKLKPCLISTCNEMVPTRGNRARCPACLLSRSAPKRTSDLPATKRWHVTYYYLATGMEGRADVRDYGIHQADTREAAIEAAITAIDGADYKNREWVRSCLSAQRFQAAVREIRHRRREA